MAPSAIVRTATSYIAWATADRVATLQMGRPGRAARQAAAHRRGERSRPRARPAGNPSSTPAGARANLGVRLAQSWRFSFDRATRDLWIADVGQETYEEVTSSRSSVGRRKLGWNRMGACTATNRYCSNGSDCRSPSIRTLAVTARDRRVRVSRTALAGHRDLPLCDYCSGRIWGVERQGSWIAAAAGVGFGITTSAG